MATTRYRKPLRQTIKDLTVRYPQALPLIGILLAYSAWISVFKLVSLSLITYFVAFTGAGGLRAAHLAHFEEVNEAFGSSELTVLALGALTFLLLLQVLNPSGQTTPRRLFDSERFEKVFIPGFLQGSVLACGVILAFLVSGIYRYLGIFVQVDAAPLAAASILIRVISIIVFVYCEELFFRDRIIGLFRALWHRQPEQYRDIAAAVSTALVFVAIKFLQFDGLGWMHGLTLFLISVALALRVLGAPVGKEDFHFGAGFWAAMLIVFHPLLSLPIFGSDFSGLILVKYQPAVVDAAHTAARLLTAEDPNVTYTETARFFTGGAGGPLASFAFQLLLIVQIAKSTVARVGFAR